VPRSVRSPAQPDHLEAIVGFHKVRQQFEAAVARGIVYKDDLVRLLQAFQHRRQAVIEGEDRGLLIVDRNDDRQHVPFYFTPISPTPGAREKSAGKIDPGK